jgi:hypothetical protein
MIWFRHLLVGVLTAILGGFALLAIALGILDHIEHKANPGPVTVGISLFQPMAIAALVLLFLTGVAVQSGGQPGNSGSGSQSYRSSSHSSSG